MSDSFEEKLEEKIRELARQHAGESKRYYGIRYRAFYNGAKFARTITLAEERERFKLDKSIRRCGECGNIGMSPFGIQHISDLRSKKDRLTATLAEEQERVKGLIKALNSIDECPTSDSVGNVNMANNWTSWAKKTARKALKQYEEGSGE